jgi:lysophospholipase
MASMHPTSTDTFTGAAGVPIHLARWEPAVPATAVVVVAHGFGEHGGRYGNLVERLVPNGWAVYIPDHRGHGRSGGHRAFIDRHAFLLDDLDQVFTRADADHPGVPVVLVGHSMGGNIALGSALRNQARLRGLVLSGPAVATSGVPAALILLAKIMGRIAPRLGVRQLSAAGVSRDPAVVAAYEADPLVFHGKMPAGTGMAIIRSSERYATELPSLTVPLLVVHGSADALVSVESGRTAHRLAGSSDKTIHVYDGLFHEVFNEPEHERVLDDVVAWISERVSRS